MKEPEYGVQIIWQTPDTSPFACLTWDSNDPHEVMIAAGPSEKHHRVVVKKIYLDFNPEGGLKPWIKFLRVIAEPEIVSMLEYFNEVKHAG